MKCPICGTALPLSSDRCPDCGYRVTRSAQPRPEPVFPQPEPQPKKKGRWGCCCCCAGLLAIPLLAAIVVLIFGFASVVTDNVLPEDFIPGIMEEFPSVELPVDPPAEAAEGCFSIRNGEITFLSELWEGGSVLTVPGTVDGQTVTAIGPGCFFGCADLTTIVLPDTVTAIGPDAFSGCIALRGLLIPEGVRTIGSGAFAACISLESLSVPASVTAIAPGCMDDCASLMYIFYDGTFESWNALYSDFITPFTAAVCSDGAYYHGAMD